jgi:hypothetical protein
MTKTELISTAIDAGAFAATGLTGGTFLDLLPVSVGAEQLTNARIRVCEHLAEGVPADTSEADVDIFCQECARTGLDRKALRRALRRKSELVATLLYLDFTYGQIRFVSPSQSLGASPGIIG